MENESVKLHHRSRKWAVLGWCLVVLIVGMAIAGALGWYVILPLQVRSRVIDRLDNYWDGSIAIGSTQVNRFGRVRLRDVCLSDPQGRVHAEARGITLMFHDFWGDRQITDIFVEEPKVRFYRIDGRQVWLWKKVSDGDPDTEEDSEVPLNSLTIRDGGGWWIEDGNVREQVDGLQFYTEYKGERRYAFHMEAAQMPGLKQAVLRGWGRKQEDGTISAEADFSSQGQTLFQGARVDVAAVDESKRRHTTLKTEVLGGNLEVNLTTRNWPDGSISCRGDLNLEEAKTRNLSVVEIGRMPGPDGVVSAKINFSAVSLSPDQFNGYALLELDNIFARQSDMLDDVFEYLDKEEKISSPAASRMPSSIRASFHFVGPLLIIDNAVLADKIYVMQVEKGSTIDLFSRKINLYIVTLQIRGISAFLGRIPIVNWGTTIFNKLVRVHAHGYWDQKVTITKNPVKDISSATRDIFTETIRMGGQIGPMVDGFFESLFGNTGSAAD